MDRACHGSGRDDHPPGLYLESDPASAAGGVSPTRLAAVYLPRQLGLRFSAKARGPSLTSSEENIRLRAG